MNDVTILKIKQIACKNAVSRERLVRDLLTRSRDVGIVVLCAPEGFGKTSVMLQYAMAFREEHGADIRMIDAEGTLPGELMVEVECAERELAGVVRPLIAIDNISVSGADEARQMAQRLRTLRDGGCSLIVSCLPSNRDMVHALGDSIKVGAQMLRVQPREYAAWARTYAIGDTLDVYGLTQGIPQLVAALRTTVEQPLSAFTELERAAADVLGSAMADVVREDAAFAELFYLMLLVGEGRAAELEREGLRVEEVYLSRLRREYPLFSLDAVDGTFACLGTDAGARKVIREAIVSMRPELLPRAVRVHMKAGRIDRAVALMRQFPDMAIEMEMIERFPASLALAGHGTFIEETLAPAVKGGPEVRLEVNAVVARYVAAILRGDTGLAKRMASELNGRRAEIEGGVRAADWHVAEACSSFWGMQAELALPDCKVAQTGKMGQAARALAAHAGVWEDMLGRMGASEFSETVIDRERGQNELDIAVHLLQCDHMLQEVLTGGFSAPDERDAALRSRVACLKERRLAALQVYTEAVLDARAMAAGDMPESDRSFVEGENVAIRCSHQALQLFFLLFEGWHALCAKQMLNARFRAQQVLKLASSGQVLARESALLLEKAAYLGSTPLVKIRDDADGIEMAPDEVTPAGAWSVALHLAAAKRASELSAWYSLHKRELFEPGFRTFARMAMQGLGGRADMLRRLIPMHLKADYECRKPLSSEVALLDAPEESEACDLGQLNVRLFGGFAVECNGHILTDAIWRRKRCGTLMSRLVLAGGSFVGRRVLTEELWPASTYARARENLYVTLSALRRALGQTKEGPQYVIAQGEGLAINNEFVTSDVGRFLRLARTVLLSRSSLSATQTIEACLKIEELYRGDLYVPANGDVLFFKRMGAELKAKFISSMERGIGMAIEEGDLSAATWMLEAALKHDPLNEGMLEYRLQLNTLSGRRPLREHLPEGLHRGERSMEMIDERARRAYGVPVE